METFAQKSIRHCLDMLAPFEASEEQWRDGQFQFYQFMLSIYQGMYEKPEDYLVFSAPYDAYVLNKKTTEKEKEHANDSRESTLRNTVQQAIQFYAMFFFQLGNKSLEVDEKSGALILSKEEYTNVLHQMERLHGAKYNAQRYALLEKLGIHIFEKDGYICIVHKEYRHAMQGVLFLCKSPDSKYKWMNFLRMDYKNAYTPIPEVSDICKTLPKESVAIITQLEDYLSGLKIKKKIRPLRGIVSDFKWKVEYIYKGKNICGFYADNSYLMICIYFNHFENINEFASTLYEEDRELFLWFKNQFPERLCKCPSNRRVYLGDEYRRICGLSNRAEIVNPDSKDMENALTTLRRYRNLHI